ncbi:unnamed protein product [Adineta steineri]|uniref:C2H2-type domain-containing protein n=1 Tax=Adineta steineri TaxID=433720 RepID=A0A815FXH2_9BILA|nr:unnamed protein product [Adineta steineri]CAF1331224.1 unnamed protein product [Adineta steineri]CAF3546143.1 unnamed protein product [Adineta steineri]CAF3711066.1 unnamed protein product [Adineta steineri]
MNSIILEKPHPSSSNESNKLIHICTQCARTFKDINNFREHLFQEHGELGVNVRQCHLCSYATLLKSKYDCHIRCHLNNRVIRCQKCNYSTINIRHMSKHERQHSISRMMDTDISETKRARISNISMDTDKDEKMKSNNEKPSFSTCFLTDKILMPDDKKSLDKSENSRSNSCCSTDDSYRTPCSHQNSLVSLRTNVWTLLRMLLPQLSLYHPSTFLIDYESDHSIDRLVTNLIQIPSIHRSYPSM